MPQDIPTTIGLIVITILFTGATVINIRRVIKGRRDAHKIELIAQVTATVICLGLWVYRALEVHESWALLQAHVDGLLLLIALMGGVLIYLHITERLNGLEIFIQPFTTILSAWAICASWWSFKLFHITTAWSAVHVICVYLGLLAVATAAGCGGLYLYVQHHLKSKKRPGEHIQILGRMANLERIEKTIISAAALGFLLITIALITGLVVELKSDYTALGPHWWLSPKIILATVAWLIFAVVMHVRFAPVFRGNRAAILSIIGFFLLIIVLVFSIKMSRSTSPHQTPQTLSPQQDITTQPSNESFEIITMIATTGGDPS